MSDNVFLVKRAIENIMNDVIQQAFNYSINHPQDSDQLNKLIKNATDDTGSFVNRLNNISSLADNEIKNIQLQQLTSELKKSSLIYLSELQSLKDSNKKLK